MERRAQVMKMVQEEHMMLGAGDQERERERLRHGPSPGLDQNGQRWRQAEDGSESILLDKVGKIHQAR